MKDTPTRRHADTPTRSSPRHACDCSFSHLIAPRLWAAHGEIAGGIGLFVDARPFDVTVLQSEFGDRAIGQIPNPGVFLRAIIIAIHDRSAKCEALKESRIRGTVNEREYFFPIEDIEIDEILVDEQFVWRRNHLITPIVPDQKQAVEREQRKAASPLTWYPRKPFS